MCVCIKGGAEWVSGGIVKGGGGWGEREEKPNLSLSLSPLTISIRLHFVLKANSDVLGLRWMAALELRFNQ